MDWEGRKEDRKSSPSSSESISLQTSHPDRPPLKTLTLTNTPTQKRKITKPNFLSLRNTVFYQNNTGDHTGQQKFSASVVLGLMSLLLASETVVDKVANKRRPFTPCLIFLKALGAHQPL